MPVLPYEHAVDLSVAVLGDVVIDFFGKRHVWWLLSGMRADFIHGDVNTSASIPVREYFVVHYCFKYFPITDCLFFRNSSGVPCAITLPPSVPPPGPNSMI